MIQEMSSSIMNHSRCLLPLRGAFVVKNSNIATRLKYSTERRSCTAGTSSVSEVPLYKTVHPPPSTSSVSAAVKVDPLPSVLFSDWGTKRDDHWVCHGTQSGNSHPPVHVLCSINTNSVLHPRVSVTVHCSAMIRRQASILNQFLCLLENAKIAGANTTVKCLIFLRPTIDEYLTLL